MPAFHAKKPIHARISRRKAAPAIGFSAIWPISAGIVNSYRGQRDRQRHHQHPADDLPARHLRGEPPGKGIADRGSHDRAEQQQIAGRERAAALPHRERDHQRSAGDGCDPEQRLRRSWVMTTATSAVAIGSIPSTTPPCEASTVCTASAIRNGNRIADAQHGDRQLRPQPAWRQRPAQHDQQRQRAQPGDAPCAARSWPGDRWRKPRCASPAACRRRSPCR